MKNTHFYRFIASLAIVFLSWSNLSAQGTLTLNEEFKIDKGEWTIRSNDKVNARIEGNKYLIEHLRPSGSWLFWKNSVMLDPSNHFTIETQMTQTSGNPEEGFGFVWGAQDAANFYSFVITSKGNYRISKYRDAKYTEIKEFTPASDIIEEQGKANKLTIRKYNDLISFYINDEWVFSTPFQSFMGPKAGFVVYGENSVAVDYLRISQEKQLPLTFRETFDNNSNGWLRGDENLSASRIENGKYIIRSKKANEVTVEYKDIPVSSSLDFLVEANMSQLAGDDENGFGIILASQDPRDSYAMIISSDGTYLISRWIHGDHQAVQDWTEAPEGALFPMGKSNKLAIRRTGTTASFFANDRFLFESSMRDFPIARIGFVVYDTLTIAVEDLSVRIGSAIPQDLPPTLTMISPSSDHTTTPDKDFNLEIGINSPSNITEVNIYVNGTFQKGGFSPADAESGFDGWIKEKIALQDGVNAIKLIVKNQSGGMITETRLVNVTKAEDGRNGQDYALFFATDEYDYWSNLVNPINDARTIAEELESHYGFNTEVVVNASREQILNKLKEYAKRKYNSEDQLSLFFMGHGKFDEFFGEGYVVCKNSLKDDEGNGSYIAHSTLRTVVNNIPCDHIFLAMDVCFGGTIDPFIAESAHRGGEENYKEMTQDEFIKRKMKYKTRRYLTSGGKEYVPDGKPGNHSPFARKFLEALRTYGGHDKIITLAELLVYFERLTPAPRSGEFGSNEPGSDFLFITK
ncbi:MAG: caspase family protein [Bacteroidia bacterium]|nr:caspase family protein [Bacteroidia bacterium]